MEIPKSWPKVKKLEAEYGAISHTSKPDLDNIVKCVADGLVHTLYADDKQIVAIKAQKRYCHPERGPALYVSVSWTEEKE
jgi:Holliday junction resolvase RusA-like endonuclease